MSEQRIFNIRELKVQYPNKDTNEVDTILDIPRLEIKRGKILFVLGNSGSGKTTFLETLALMSHYETKESEIEFYPSKDLPPISYKKIWNNDEESTDTRRKYFSFMFQSTQLFPKYSLKENVALTQIIKQIDKKVALENAAEGLKSIGMLQETDRYSFALSGGQIQRGAFVRAALTGGVVLFADEPTGNLGDVHSHRVMEHIRHYVDNSSESITAIIVTHNIQLALLFGDEILIIKKNKKIESENIISSNIVDGNRVWPLHNHSIESKYDEKQSSVSIIQERMGDDNLEEPNLSLYSKNSYRSPIKKFNGGYFRKYFAARSTHELSLYHSRNSLIVFILFLAFSAIGFSIGSLDVLKEKMADPYVNWIAFDIPQDKNHLAGEYLTFLSQDNFKQEVNIAHISGFNKLGYNLFSTRQKGYITLWGRSVGLDDPIYSAIRQTQIPLIGKYFNGNRDIGIILTEETASILGVDSTTQYISWQRETDNKDYPFPIPLRGVVKNLPGKNAFLVTLYFESKEAFDETRPFYPSKTKVLSIFMKTNVKIDKYIIDSLRNILSLSGKYNSRLPYISQLSQDSISRFNSNGKIIRISMLNPELSLMEIDSLFTIFKNNPLFAKYSQEMILCPEIPMTELSIIDKFNEITINVNNLDKVSKLRNIIYQKYGLEIDLAKVESLNNYLFVTRLTQALSFFIIVLCIISICVFIIYILYIHLYKNRNYLGLLKAFGVPSKTLIFMYFIRMNTFLIYSIAIAFIISCIFGYSGLLKDIISLFIKVDQKYLYFNVYDSAHLGFVFSVICFSSISIYLTSLIMLKRPPGDLIYDRVK